MIRVCYVTVELGCLLAMATMLGWWVIPVAVAVGLIGGIWEAEWRDRTD